jgi:hypothetical protein
MEKVQTPNNSVCYRISSEPYKIQLILVHNTFWAAVGLERGPLSLVNNLRSYLEENRSYDRRDSLRWSRYIIYPVKLALASLTGGDRPIGIVR